MNNKSESRAYNKPGFFVITLTPGKLINIELMDKSTLLTFLSDNGKIFVQFFCPIFGVLAQESYQALRDDNYKFKKVIPKLVLAWFVCLVFGSLITEDSFLNKYYPILIITLAFIHRRAADWLMNDFFNFFLKYINSKTKKDE